MQSPWALLVLGASTVLAFPGSRSDAVADCPQQKADIGNFPKPTVPDKRSQLEKRLGFDPKAQAVSTAGEHAFVAPAAGDQRGPCPGLNALANHGYLPHNGVATIPTFIEAVDKVYGMGKDLGTFLALYGTAFDGSPFSQTPGFSIGGSTTASQSILGGRGLQTTPAGLTGSHNKYEADASATRGDLYFTGDSSGLMLSQFQQYYDALPENIGAHEQYDGLLNFRRARFNDSLANNGYFFYPPFVGLFVSPAGFLLPPAIMSNKSEEYPEGYLDKETLKSFFAVSGESGNFTYNPGHERIPDNWYKTAIGAEYTITSFVADVLNHGIKDPRLLTVGGNTGSPNSFVPVDLSLLTKGVYKSGTLTQGKTLLCFILGTIVAESPVVLRSVYSDVKLAINPLIDSLNGSLAALDCPHLSGIDNHQYRKYPGWWRSHGGV